MLKKILCILLSVFLLTGTLAVTASADYVATGEYGDEGDNITWTLGYDGVLTFSGTGYMMDCTQTDDQWNFNGDDLSQYVYKVVIEDGIEGIGTYAFSYFTNLVQVDIPDSVYFFGAHCFNKCTSLETVTVPSSVEFFEQGCFSGSGLKILLFLGDSIDELTAGNYRAFEGLEDVTAVIPEGFRVDNEVIDETNANDDLYFYNAKVRYYDSVCSSDRELAEKLSEAEDGTAVVCDCMYVTFYDDLEITSDVMLLFVNGANGFIDFHNGAKLVLNGGDFSFAPVNSSYTIDDLAVDGTGGSVSLYGNDNTRSADINHMIVYNESITVNFKGAFVNSYDEDEPATLNFCSGRVNTFNLAGSNAVNILGDGECRYFNRDTAGPVTNGYRGHSLGVLFLTDTEGMEIVTLKGELVLVTAGTMLAEPSMSLSLGGDIGINFYYKYNNHLAERAGLGGEVALKYTFDGQTFTAETRVPEDGEYDLKSTFKVNAKAMTEPVTAVLTCDGVTISEETVTVRDYALAITEGPDDVYSAALKELAAAMLYYGAAVQTQFEYRTDDLATEGLDYTLTPAGHVTGGIDYTAYEGGFASCGLAIAGATLVLNSETAYRLYFTVTDRELFNAAQVTLNGVTIDPVKKGQYYYYEISDIPAAELFDTQTLYFGENAVPATAVNYVVSARNNGDLMLRTTVEALENYVFAAQAFFA